MSQSFENIVGRPPVVVIMGHVDHGKTTLLDYIRKTSVANREAGGITQSVGASEIEHNPSNASGQAKKITFIDTPGHEAFTAMRSRGASIADLAIVVVAADDGVKPQTLEAVKIAHEAKMPFVIAINKIDRDGVTEEKAKNDLTANNILLEGFGGDISYQGISALTGDGVSELLDLVLLTAEVEELTTDLTKPASGFVLESKIDSRRGATAVLIIKDGVLRHGDSLCAGSVHGVIKALEDFQGKPIQEARASAPVVVLGFEGLVSIGEMFTAGMELSSAVQEKPVVRESHFPVSLPESEALVVLLKADVSGSLEVLQHVLQSVRLPDDVHVRVVHASVGDITDGDVKLAISSKAIILGFNAKATKPAKTLAEAHHVLILQSKIIYELVQAFEKHIKTLYAAPVRGDLEILGVFGKKEGNQVVGGKVVAGELINQTNLEVKRGDTILGVVRVINLQQSKKDAARVLEGNECGLLVTDDVSIRLGDHLLLREE
ncbi:MAG: hypothetical protein COU08_03435 [Candidatus Harrisonbacteria bacterium CG10_big_fil_rev_8_21_14_0_10_42_17]|uniref:Tr-type G domain-containing protein n=1 Tax=Candidatus Harrisonbacteria bacterium CG10_big_fil_rev_8_21_14_0_10_42_17 TaxID=1974584 RepID=A0A2M6WHI3_9BACT|nr:MAG: hypothetical protein COU08_03435 [Candidatus Harrisonbacteria bacterium CG10_big_fil_rev_8_21_14_0_10_42_17]